VKLKTVLAHVATVTSSLLAYMLLYMLGLLRQRKAARLATGALVLAALAVVLAGWAMPPERALALSAGVACALGVLALGTAVRSALRGDRLTWAAVGAVFCMLVALVRGELDRRCRAHGCPGNGSRGECGGGDGLPGGIIAGVLWVRYSYLLELSRSDGAMGPAYDPVTRMRSHSPARLSASAKRSWLPSKSTRSSSCAARPGSGKTTQLPKIALALGRGKCNAKPGQKGQLIGHTQPRRIAASSVAKRIAEELKTPLGEVVGFKVRFQDRLSRDASVKLMTDGILLAETQTDPLLKAYDTIIIDEAHERSLNIDFCWATSARSCRAGQI
jgi:hypothetical protein